MSMNIETWKDIPWYEWYYQVSDIWNIRSLDRIELWYKLDTKYLRKKTWCILKQKTKSNWYKEVNLSKQWFQKMWYVHRLVALSFLWLAYNDTKTFVCHKDDYVSNNKLENLFLWTHSDNMQDMILKWRNNPYRIRNKILTYQLVENIRDKWKFWTYPYLSEYWWVHVKTIEWIIKNRIWIWKSLLFLKENNYGN